MKNEKRLCFDYRLIVFISFILFSSECYSQRYEIWVNPDRNRYEAKGFYGLSNDSLLTIYTKSTLFFPSRDFNIRWEKIGALNIRNKTKNDMGILIGTGLGLLTSYLLLESEKKGNIYLGSEMGGGIIVSFGITGGCALIGHLVTRAKIKVPLHGISSNEKNQTLKNLISRKH